MSRLSAGLGADANAPGAAVADAAAATAIAFALSYGTDDPSYTADGTYTLPDGDAVAGVAQIGEELTFFSTAVLADVAALRTQLNALLASLRAGGVLKT